MYLPTIPNVCVIVGGISLYDTVGFADFSSFEYCGPLLRLKVIRYLYNISCRISDTHENSLLLSPTVSASNNILYAQFASEFHSAY